MCLWSRCPRWCPGQQLGVDRVKHRLDELGLVSELRVTVRDKDKDKVRIGVRGIGEGGKR